MKKVVTILLITVLVSVFSSVNSVNANSVSDTDFATYTEYSEDNKEKWVYSFRGDEYSTPYNLVILEYYDGFIVQPYNVGQTTTFYSEVTQQHEFSFEMSVGLYVEAEFKAKVPLLGESTVTAGISSDFAWTWKDTEIVTQGFSNAVTWKESDIGSWEYVSVIEEGKLYEIYGSVRYYTRSHTECTIWNFLVCDTTWYEQDLVIGDDFNHVEYTYDRPKKAFLLNPRSDGYIYDDEINPSETTSGC